MQGCRTSNGLSSLAIWLPTNEIHLAIRLKRTLEELAPFRAGVGKSATPDLDEEDALRARIASLTADRHSLVSQLEGLSLAVLEFAAVLPGGNAAEPAPAEASLDQVSPLSYLRLTAAGASGIWSLLWRKYVLLFGDVSACQRLWLGIPTACSANIWWQGSVGTAWLFAQVTFGELVGDEAQHQPGERVGAVRGLLRAWSPLRATSRGSGDAGPRSNDTSEPWQIAASTDSGGARQLKAKGVTSAAQVKAEQRI